MMTQADCPVPAPEMTKAGVAEALEDAAVFARRAFTKVSEIKAGKGDRHLTLFNDKRISDLRVELDIISSALANMSDKIRQD